MSSSERSAGSDSVGREGGREESDVGAMQGKIMGHGQGGRCKHGSMSWYLRGRSRTWRRAKSMGLTITLS